MPVAANDRRIPLQAHHPFGLCVPHRVSGSGARARPRSGLVGGNPVPGLAHRTPGRVAADQSAVAAPPAARFRPHVHRGRNGSGEVSCEVGRHDSKFPGAGPCKHEPARRARLSGHGRGNERISMSPERIDSARAELGVAGAQAAFYLGTGIWPLVHRATFERVTGPKTDFWLVQTVGVTVTAVGLGLAQAVSRRRAVPTELRTVALATAGGLAAVDVVFVGRRRISPVYLLDAAAEAALIAAWVLARRGRRREPRARTP